MDFIRRYKLLFGLAWLLLFAAWYFFRADGYASSSTAFVVTLVKVLDLAVLVCLCNYILIPRLLYKKKYALFAVCFVAMILASSLLKMQVLGRIMNNAYLLDWTTGWKVKIYDNVLPHFFLVLTGAAFKLMIDFLQLQNRVSDIAREKAEAELGFLKQQINPHFLFNALNTVYFQIDKSNSQARNSLHQLSEMLRYQLYEAGEERIPIEKEIQYLEDYIALQTQRKENVYNIKFSVDPAVKGFFIEPFLLLPFVENCFKHISHFTESENFIFITLSMKDERMIFSAENSCDESTLSNGDKGIGIANTRRRLELLYPNDFKLDILKTQNRFLLTLALDIHLKNNDHAKGT